MADRNLWQQRLKTSVNSTLQARTFAAFNTNIDAVVHLHGPRLQKLLQQTGDTWRAQPWRAAEFPAVVRTVADFATVLYMQLQEGKSCHIVAEGAALDWITHNFPDAVESMGGQAGIIANQMAALQAESYLYTPLLSPRQARLFNPAVKAPQINVRGQVDFVPILSAANPQDAVKINWIFEYAKGEEYVFGEQKIITPRANRVIMATRPKESVMAFSAELVPQLPQMGERFNTAFMAGYHYAAPTDNGGRDFTSYLEYTRRTLAELTARNPELRLHYEYVPMKHEQLEAPVLRGICPFIHSLGINENEIKRALQQLGQAGLADNIAAAETAYNLYNGALFLMRDLGVQRVHVHNLGYYVVVMRKPYPLPAPAALTASLYASAVNAMKAKNGGYPQAADIGAALDLPLSDAGYNQLDMFTAQVAGEAGSVTDGIWERSDHYVMVIPAHVVFDPLSTVGMGDTISSSSFAMESSLCLLTK